MITDPSKAAWIKSCNERYTPREQESFIVSLVTALAGIVSFILGVLCLVLLTV